MYEHTIIGPAPVPVPAPRDRTVVTPAPRAFVPRAPLLVRPRPGEPYHWARTPTLVAVHGVDEPIDDGSDDTTEVFEPAPIRLLYAPAATHRATPLLWLLIAAALTGGGVLIALATLA